MKFNIRKQITLLLLITITLFCPGCGSQKKNANTSNAQSDEYEVVMFIGADEEMAYATYYTKQNADLIAGTGPDLFVANSNASFPDLVQKGIMEELLPWIERDLNPEDYTGGVDRLVF